MSGSYNLGTASGRIVVNGSGAEKGFAVAKAAASAFFDSVNKRADEVQDFGKKLVVASATGVAGFGFAVKAASGFEARLSAVKAVSGATTEEMDQIGEAALRIGAKTSFGATDAASAFEELVKAGVSTKDAIEGAADATVAMAEAGEIALPRAAEIAAAAMNNFNLSAQDMPKVADTVAGAANASAISVEDFAQSMNQTGSVANLVGLDFEDMAVAIAEMGNAGIKGSDAGTSLKTMLMNLQPKTKEQINLSKELGLLTFDQADAMKALAADGIKPASNSIDDITTATSNYLSKQLGLKKGTKKLAEETEKYLMKNGGMQNAFFDQSGSMKGLSEVQEELQKSLKGMSEEQKIAALETLFGADAIRAAAIMAKNGAEGFDSMAESMGKVTAADVAKTRMDNLSGAIEEMKGSFETIAIRIGQVFIPVLTNVIQGITAVLDWIGGASEGFFKWATGIAAAGTAMGGFIGFAIMLLAKMGPLLAIIIGIGRGFAVFKVLKGAAAAFSGLAAGAGLFARVGAGMVFLFKNIAAAIVPFWGVITKLRYAFMLLTGPVGIIIGIVAALVAAFIWAYNNITPFRDFMNNLWAGIVAAAQVAVAWFQNTVLPALAAVWEGIQAGAAAVVAWFQGPFVAGMKAAWDWIVTQAQWLWQQLVPVFQAGAQMIGDLVNLIVMIAKGMWEGMAPTFAMLGTLFNILGTLWTVLWTTISAVWSVLGPALMAAISAAWTGLVSIISIVWETIKGVISGALTIIKGIFQLFSALFRGDWAGMWDAVKTIVSGVWTVIKSIIGGAIQLVVAIVKTWLSVLLAFWGSVWNSIKGVVAAVWQTIKTLVGGAVNGIKSFINAGLNAIKALWAAGWAVLKNKVSSILNAIKAVVSIGIAAVKNNISNTLNTIKALWSVGWALLKTIVSNGLNAIKSAVSSGIDAVVGFFRALPGKATGALSSLVGSMGSIGRNIVQGLIKGISGMAGAAVQKIKDLGSSMLNGVKGILGIASPSKEMIKVGKWIVEGVTVGIKDTQKSAVDAMKKLATQLIDQTIKNAETRKKLEEKVNAARKAMQKNSNSAYLKAVKAAEKRVSSAEKALAKKKSKGNKKRLSDAKKSLATAEKNRRKSLSASGKKALDAYKKAEKNLRDFNKKNGTLTVKQAKKQAEKLLLQTKLKKSSKMKDKTVADFVKTRESNVEKLKKVNDDLKAAITAKDATKKQVADSLQNEFNLGTLAQASETTGQKLKFEDVQKYATGVLGRVKNFQGKLQKLAAAKVHPALIEEVAALGSVDGSAMADAILSGNKAQRNALNNTYKGIGSSAASAGAIVAGQMHDVGIQALRGLAKGLSDENNLINKTIDNLVKKTINATKKGFQVRSPSRLFNKEVGVFLPAGISEGIKDALPELLRTMDSMVHVPEVPGATFGALGLRSGVAAKPLLSQTDLETLRPIMLTIEGVDTNNADEVAGTIIKKLNEFQRTRSAYAGSR